MFCKYVSYLITMVISHDSLLEIFKIEQQANTSKIGRGKQQEEQRERKGNAYKCIRKLKKNSNTNKFKETKQKSKHQNIMVTKHLWGYW